ncbi:MAG: polyribonucleotide nucleotidyltransferase [Candidatus Kapaibacterium sp.]
MISKKVSINFEGREYTLESGKYAKFASGSVMVSCGDSMVLVAATASQKELDNIDFLPLQVEYREKTASAGKIPGGFLKREGRPSDNEVLTSRLIDRPIRPMIPKTWHYETQIIATVYSADPNVLPDTLGAVGASAALMISDIPFNGPISEVRVGRINGEFIANPTYDQIEECDIDMIVGGTDNAITMVEGESKEISEEDFLAAIEFAHDKIKQLNGLQKELAEAVGKVKREFIEFEVPEEIREFIKESIKDKIDHYVHAQSSKEERSAARKEIQETAENALTEKYGEDEEHADKIPMYLNEVVGKLEKSEMRKMIIEEKRRLDGRAYDEIRPITCEVGILPRTHGSALFTRGETQSLSTLTLGTSRDEQMIDGLHPVFTERFMLHYNFPPFCTGETGRLFVGRREIGHGHLAWRALKAMLPEQELFPYTLRIVSDILESNGSSSMATVCAGSLCMFDAGVPFRKSVAGIAMGLIKEDDQVAVLSDILGDEDFLGDMDFKVAGTVDGITAFQMDIKIEGLSIEIMKTALEQARRGRLHILGIMNEALGAPRLDISAYAPKFETIKVPVDMIGAVIGPGGEHIRNIVKESGAEINIDDDGTVTIAATSTEDSEKAKEMIAQLTRKPEEGKIYTGTVKEIREGLGAFVEILPKVQGLLHISQIAYERVEEVSDYLKEGDKIDVKLLEITRDGKYRLSRKAVLPKPEGYVEQDDDRPQRRSSGRPGGSRSDSRGGRPGGNRPGGNRPAGDRR